MPLRSSSHPGEARSVGLADGRTLCYAEYGDLSGTPVLFFHGVPGSHKEAELWHLSAVRHGVRLIAPDRPGIGLSTFQPGRRFVDWPTDLAVLLRHLGLARSTLRILALSGGSPYALACLHASSVPCRAPVGDDLKTAIDDGNAPGDQEDGIVIHSTAIVSGMYPLSFGLNGIKVSTRFSLWLVSRLWFLLVPLLDWLLGGPARRNPALFKARVLKEAEARPMVDRKLLADDHSFAEGFVEAARHAFAQETRGQLYEAGLMGRHWGFELDRIDGRTVTMWQGGFDDACPVVGARRAHGQLQGSNLNVCEYEGHLTLWARRQDQIWESLLA